MITYSTSFGSRPARSSAPLMAIAPSSGAPYADRPPPSFPNGVLAVATMTDLLMPLSVTTGLGATAAREAQPESRVSCPRGQPW